jgi:hypothetical protein
MMFGMMCVMLFCAPVIGAWSSYVKKREPSKRVRYIGNGFCVAFVPLIFFGVFGKWILDETLISAAEAGDTATAELILRTGIDVNTKGDNTDATPLMYAASNGHTDTVKALLRHHPDLNHLGGFSPEGHSTALGLAIAHNHLDTARVLEAAGAK